MSGFDSRITVGGKAAPEWATIPCQVRSLLDGGRCDSATLELQKFPNLQKRQGYAEIKSFCAKVEESKKHVATDLRLPEIPGSVSFTAVSKGWLLVNHTGGIVENSNLSLHRFFNCPTIPGSALKGIARNAARFDEDKERFARVFGGAEKGKSNQAGSVAFLMAIPENTNWELVVDVLTPHGGVDTKNPVPVFFPAVKTGAVFRFVVAPTARSLEGDVEFAAKYLKIALNEHGVGAKTAAGYGWFEVCEEGKR